ncbi:hypothetical protein [Methanolobus bombayensis]|nr:hypothetical protein [Methanolobus bombayensis]MBP1908610.1 hypothetical protein [Methanolobus bombayensis]
MPESTINDDSSSEELRQLVICKLVNEEYGVQISNLTTPTTEGVLTFY